MWWNFVGRTHEEVVGFREAWHGPARRTAYADGRFGIPVGDGCRRSRRPTLPNARLKERR